MSNQKTISKQDLKLLKNKKIKCLSVKYREGSCYFFVSLENNDFHSIEIEHQISAEDEKRYSADSVKHSLLDCHYATHFDSDPLFTLVEFLKEGDVVTAKFYECNNNGYLDDSEYCGQLRPYSKLYRDDLTISVKRLVRGKPKQFNFLIAASVCADSPNYPNNSARICRRTYN